MSRRILIRDRKVWGVSRSKGSTNAYEYVVERTIKDAVGTSLTGTPGTYVSSF